MSGRRTVRLDAIQRAGAELHKRIGSLDATFEMSLAMLGVALAQMRKMGVNDQGIQEAIALFKSASYERTVIRPDASTIAKVLEGVKDAKQ